MRFSQHIKDTIVSVLIGTCAFILGFFMLIAVVLMIVLIAKMFVTTPATAGSLPQVPGVVLDDTYAPVSKAAAPPPRPDLICWRNTERAEWRWAFTGPAPRWQARSNPGGNARSTAPWCLETNRPSVGAERMDDEIQHYRH